MRTEKAQDIEEGLGFGESKRLPTVNPEPHTRISLRSEFTYSFVYLLIHSFIHPTSISKLHYCVSGPYTFYLHPILLIAYRQLDFKLIEGKDCITSAHKNSEPSIALGA